MKFKELQGKKTYIVAVATICYALGGVVSGYLSFGEMMNLVFASLGLSGLRQGVEKLREEVEVPVNPKPETYT